MKTQTQTYSVYAYDVHGNFQDGYDINDIYMVATVTIRVKPVVYNPSTPHALTVYSPTDLQLSRAVGGRGLVWDGDPEWSLYATDKATGKPVCELRRWEAPAPGSAKPAGSPGARRTPVRVQGGRGLDNNRTS